MPLQVYQKDEATGIVSQNCGKAIRLLSNARPAVGTSEESDWVAARNHRARVYIPDDNEPYDIIVRSKGKLYVVIEGVTNTPTAKKATPICIEVRQEQEGNLPTAPVAIGA